MTLVASNVTTAGNALLRFPFAPMCVDSRLPPPPPPVARVVPCRDRAAVSWPAASGAMPWPTLSWDALVLHASWSWLGSLPAGVPGGPDAASPAQVPPAAVWQAHPGVIIVQSGMRAELVQQWRTIAAAQATGVRFYAVFVQQPGQAATAVGVAGNMTAYLQATGQTEAAPFDGSMEALLVLSMTVERLPLSPGIRFHMAAGNEHGMSQLSTSSAPVSISAAVCDRFIITIDPRAISQVSQDSTGGAFASPVLVGASPASAFAHQALDTSSSAGQVAGLTNAVDPRLGPAAWTAMLRVPQQPQVPTIASPLLLSLLSTPLGVGFELQLPATPGEFETVQVQCTSSMPDAVTVSPSEFSFNAASASSGFRQWLRVQQLPPSTGQVQQLHKWQRDVQVGCQVTSSTPRGAQVYDDVPRLEVPLRVLPTVLPVFGDVLTQLPSGQLQSAWARSRRSSGLPSSSQWLQPAYDAVLRAAQAAPVGPGAVVAGDTVFDMFASPRSTKQEDHFSLVLGGSQNITITADCAHRVRCVPTVPVSGFPAPAAASRFGRPVQPFSFAPGVRVYLGDVQLRVLAVSSDGLALQAVTPPYSVMCPAPDVCAGSGAYRGLWLANPPVIPHQWLQHVHATWLRRATGSAADHEWVHAGDDLFVLGAAAWDAAASQTVLRTSTSHNSSVLGGVTACPMACPGAGDVPQGATSAGPQRQRALQSVGAVGYGPYVTDTCVGYVPPGPVCRDAADPSHALCAYGAGDACAPCGEGALCPGGYRRWPKPGYWASAEDSPAGVARCAAPSQDRCLGWDVINARSLCGTGYRGFRCSRCDVGWFPESSGACSACPESQGGLELLIPALILAGCAAGLFVVVVGAIRCVVRCVVSRKGGSVSGGISTAAQFVAWTVSMLQVIVQVGKAASPGLPAYLQAMYTRLNVLQFDSTGLVHPACLSQSPFLQERVSMLVTLVLMLVTLGITAVRAGEPSSNVQQTSVHEVKRDKRVTASSREVLRRKRAQKLGSMAGTFLACWPWASIKPQLRRILFTLLTLLYALMCNTVLGLLYCRQVDVEDGGRISAKWLLVSNPFYECFSGDHRLPGYMALVLLVVYIIGYPVLTFLWVRRRIQAVLAKSQASAAYLAAVDRVRAAKAARRAVRKSSVGGIGGNPRSILRIAMQSPKGLAGLLLNDQTLNTNGAHRSSPHAQHVHGGYDSDEEEMLALHLKASQRPKILKQTISDGQGGLLEDPSGLCQHTQPQHHRNSNNPMFTISVPQSLTREQHSTHNILLYARRLGSRAALPVGDFAGILRNAHLLQPAQHAQDHNRLTVDEQPAAEHDDTSALAGYRHAILHTSFDSMESTRERTKALRAGMAVGGSDDDWLRHDIHRMYAKRTAQAPVLSAPVRLSGVAGGSAEAARLGKHIPVGGSHRSSNVAQSLASGASMSLGEDTGVAHRHLPASRCCWSICCCWACPGAALGMSKRSRMCWQASCSAWRHRNDAPTPEEAALRHMINHSPLLLSSASLGHFLNNEFKASQFYFRQVDMMLLLGLASAVVFFADVSTRSMALLKFFVTLLIVGAVAGSLVYQSPYLPQEKWKENVKVYSLVLAVASALLNYVLFAEGELAEQPLGRGGGRTLSLVVFVLSMGLFLMLVVSFWRVLVRVAEAEAKALARRRRRLKAFVTDLPEHGAVQYVQGGNPLVMRTLSVQQQGSGAGRSSVLTDALARVQPARDTASRQAFGAAAVSRRRSALHVYRNKRGSVEQKKPSLTTGSELDKAFLQRKRGAQQPGVPAAGQIIATRRGGGNAYSHGLSKPRRETSPCEVQRAKSTHQIGRRRASMRKSRTIGHRQPQGNRAGNFSKNRLLL